MSDNNLPEGVKYQETQRFSNWILWMTLISMGVGVWFWFINEVFFVKDVLLDRVVPIWFVVLSWISIGIVIPAVVYSVRFTLRIEKGDLIFRYFPFQMKFHRFPLREIRKYKIVRYDPLGDYGGWGVRKNKFGIAFIAQSNRGVKLQTKDDKILMFSSETPKDLWLAIDEQFKDLNITIQDKPKKVRITDIKKERGLNP